MLWQQFNLINLVYWRFLQNEILSKMASFNYEWHCVMATKSMLIFNSCIVKWGGGGRRMVTKHQQCLSDKNLFVRTAHRVHRPWNVLNFLIPKTMWKLKTYPPVDLSYVVFFQIVFLQIVFSKLYFPDCIIPNCIFPNCIFPNCIFKIV